MTDGLTDTPPNNWHVDAGDNASEILVREWSDNEGFDVCSFAVDETERPLKNAQLAAAAPDLLGALSALVKLNQGGLSDDDSLWLTPARAAIAKAEGK